MSNKKAAIINGDGTGPELVNAMVKVLKSCNTNVELITCDAGSEWWEKNKGSSYISEEVWETLRNSDACFKGPTTTVPNPDAPRSVAVSIRQKFQLYANIRPIKTYKISKLQLNFICVRESTEGLYAGIEFKTSDDSAVAIRKTTGKGCRRVVKKAFELAKQKGFKKVFAITKRNILKETDGIFWKAVTDENKQYPDIEVEEYYIDNMTQQLVKNPERFNDSLLLSTNLFMDIISECASGHVGSIGNVYSGNYGDTYAMFEPAHGSAPKHARQDKVNPVATILSGAWMVEYLGEKHISDAIFKATEEIIDEGKFLTYDLGGSASLSKMAEEIAQRSASLVRK
ncbi:isocitrate/isopropylmalate dehydrogenase family protein [Candidatus Nitrosocosmicus hydrocola]|uniref:isocitrate/isopropylmalate dehydrogenase family protein n=1 Tax=Candidatus Nitrosocosmicus hydrocola TaxID=1826872 RepID=UPI000A525169|nr:isocitrate/isopropylmalate dehydrogenase family protein [Candidatus Nitrosocosmicus hydrocola]